MSTMSTLCALCALRPAAIVPPHLYAGWGLDEPKGKLARSFGMKLSGCVHSLKIAPKTGFEGNPTLHFGHRCFFHLFLDATRRARNHHFLSTNPIFSPQDLGIEQKRLKPYGTAISWRFQPCKNIPPTPTEIVSKPNLKHPLANS